MTFQLFSISLFCHYFPTACLESYYSISTLPLLYSGCVKFFNPLFAIMFLQLSLSHSDEKRSLCVYLRKSAESVPINIKFTHDVISLMRLWQGVSRHGSPRAETFIFPNSLCRICSTLTEYTNSIGYFIKINRLSSITLWWKRLMFSLKVAKVGLPKLGSYSRFSHPLISSTGLFFLLLIRLEHHPLR